jgi:hypothetical protein
MAEDRAVRRRLNRMRDARVEALRTQARQQAALDILNEQGSVSVDEIDRRVEATFVEPTDDALRNLLAQKTRAGVEYERREIEKLRAARERAEERVTKCEAMVEDARASVRRIDEQITAREEALQNAQILAAMADPEGDADAAPRGRDVGARAEVASAQASARGTGEDATEQEPERDVAEGDAPGNEG